jgi:hypothetical protein
MINTKSKNKKLTRFLTVLILLGGFFLIKGEVFAWTEPTAAPPGGNVKAPINISPTAQVKIGPLTLGVDSANPGLLRLYPTGSLINGCAEGQLAYWSGLGLFYCNAGASWNSLKTAGGFELFNNNQIGWGYLKNDDYPEVEYAIKAVGYNQDGDLPYYTGIEGAASWNDPTNYGIYGTDVGFNNAYAGYFQGNVGVSKSTGGETKFQVGSNSTTDQVSLCLNDSGCITTWPLGGGSFWTQNNTDTYLTKIDKNLALGGSDQNNSAFYVNVANNIDNNVKTFIGQPEDLAQAPSGLPVSFFCGDGACRTAPPIENNTNCSIDCPPDITSNPLYSAVLKAIFWTTDEPNWGTLYYATEADYLSNGKLYTSTKNASYDGALTNGVFITPLPATQYRGQIKTWDEYGNVTYSGGFCYPNPTPCS